jgi:proteasome lid subunit RPN8/RPN11/DNA-directed RNA polymerase subunit RPC12/RpoP
MLITSANKIEEKPGASASLGTWQMPRCPFLVEYSSAVLEQIRQDGARGAEQENGGVLFGNREPGRICIRARKPIQCEHAIGPGFILSRKDEERLAQLILSAATDPAFRGLQVLGWYHFHIRSKIFLSERDRQIHFRYFAAPYQIALVIRPVSERPVHGGVFFREASGDMRTESSYDEFTIDAPRLAPELGQATPPEPPRQLTSVPPKSERQAAEALCPRCGSRNLRRSRRRGPIERVRGILGFYSYRCHECLSRFFLKTSPALMERGQSNRHRRPEERRRSRRRTRREILLWGGGMLGFLAILYFLIRDTGPKPD